MKKDSIFINKEWISLHKLNNDDDIEEDYNEDDVEVKND